MRGNLLPAGTRPWPQERAPAGRNRMDMTVSQSPEHSRRSRHAESPDRRAPYRVTAILVAVFPPIFLYWKERDVMVALVGLMLSTAMAIGYLSLRPRFDRQARP